jgi:hypothetical protein
MGRTVHEPTDGSGSENFVGPVELRQGDIVVIGLPGRSVNLAILRGQ